ncbi:sugar-binding protein [Paenibacillus phytohabitans]|uniref:sugar-binding protein n=1 Tax=Paenibacillus phytohabitans TaxID=2654978 RepID=UPI003009BC06
MNRRSSKQAVWALIIVLVFSMAAEGFPSAVYGEPLRAIASPGGIIPPDAPGTPASVTESVYEEPASPVITDWEDDFRSSFGKHTHALALEAEDIVIDGVVDEWDRYAEIRLPEAAGQVLVEGWGGPADVSASVYLAYDQSYFYWTAKVTDNVHAPVSDSTMWRGDSIQFAFSPGGSYGPEYAINYMDGQAHVWQFSEGGAAAGAEVITAAASRTGQETFYEVRMPWSAISTGMPENGELPFTLLFNDNDGAGRRGWLEWTPGIGKAKSPADHAVIHLVPSADPWSFWVEGPREINVNTTVSYSVYAVNTTSEPHNLHLSSSLPGVEADFTLPAGSAAGWSLPFTTADPGEQLLEFTLAQQGSTAGKRQELKVTAVLDPAEIEAMLDSVNAQLPGLEQLLLQCEAQGLSTDYERIDYTVIKDFIGYGKEDIVQGRLGRAQYVAAELETMLAGSKQQLEGYLDGSLTPQSAPRYVSGRPEISGYSFVGDTIVRSTGVTEERPIFFTGYGHFNQVKRDIPKLQDLGANVIQIELGPRDVILDKQDFVNRYTVNRSGAVSATAAITEGISHSGNHSLKIANASPRQPNVFINVAQTLAVEPETTYEFKVWVKGDNARNVWFPGGTGWKQRQPLPGGTYDWTEVTFEYTTAKGEVSYPLVILSENTGTVWVDDLSVVKAGSTVNLIQNPGFEELGGYSPDKEYVVSTRKIQSDLLPALQRAEDYDVAVNLLISPHYFPDWVLAKWPELKVENNGSIKFSLFQPMAQSIIEDYLRSLIPAIKDYDSLQSLTLTNESVYMANKDAYALPAWQEYLEGIYDGDIGQLNGVYQTAYSSFSEVPMPENITASTASYDYVLFNQDYFASWHEWMAGIIHELAPELPVQAKIMGDPRGSLSWGVDIERFSEFSQINGNDNWNYINEGPKGFMEELSFYDLQASFKEAPVFNSEHHLIADGDKMYTPEQAKHVRSVLWQSAIHGRGGSAIWVWERTYNETASTEGSILHRPDVVAQAGRTNLDLNRLAGQVTAFQNEQPQVAILYSTASGVFSGDYSAVSLRSYEALSYSGYKAGYVSEGQVDNGGLDDYKLLIVPNASRVNPETLSGIRQFMEQGGRVLLIGSHALELTPHGAALSAADRSYVFAHADKISATDWTAGQIRDYLLPVLQTVNPGQLLLLDPADNAPVYNVEWRTVEYGGHTLMNVVNYGPEPVAVKAVRNGLTANGFMDLITDQSTAGQTIELQPLTPYLFSLDFPAETDN